MAHVNTFGTPLQFHVAGTPYQEVARSLVQTRLAARHITFEQYAATFDHAALLQAKSLVIVLCPIFAFLTALTMLPRRRHAVGYLVFALHAMSMMLLIIMVVHLAVIPIVSAIQWRGVSFRWQTVDQAETVVMLVILGSYLRTAVVRVFGVGRSGAVMRAALLTVAFVITVFTYRGILFFITFATT